MLHLKILLSFILQSYLTFNSAILTNS